MEEALVAMLLADAALGAQVSTRVNWMKRPQASALPAVVLQRIGGGGVGDTYVGQDGLERAIVQVDCWGASYGAAKGAARLVRAVLQTPANPRFTGIFITAERDFLEPAANGLPDIYRTSLDAEVWFLQP